MRLRPHYRYLNCSLGICVLSEPQTSEATSAVLLLSIQMSSSRESVRMKNYCLCLVLFIFSGLLLLKGEEVGSTQKTVNTEREHSILVPFRRYWNNINSQSAKNSSATSTIPHFVFDLRGKDNNATGDRFDRSGLSGFHQTNHIGQTIKRQWRRRRT